MLSKNTTYLSKLDHLRFLAALWVVIFHWHGDDMVQQSTTIPLLTSVIREGEIGVSLFMVLSGFILTHISLGKTINYRAFIFTRVVRIYPLYVLALVIDAYSSNRTVEFLPFLQMLTPFANLHKVVPAGFPQMWTIPVEFQFYLVFPFLMAFVARYGTRYPVGLIGVAIGIRWMLFLLDGTLRDAAYWTILGRIDQFGIGMLAAIVYSKRQRLLSSPVFVPASIVLVYAWVLAFQRWTGGGYFGTLAPTSPAWIISPTLEGIVLAFVTLTYLMQKWRLPAALDRALSYLGATSFSIYVWHWPIYTIFKHYPSLLAAHAWYWTFLFAFLPLVLVVSAISYQMIEKPFLTMRAIYARKNTITTAETVASHAEAK